MEFIRNKYMDNPFNRIYVASLPFLPDQITR